MSITDACIANVPCGAVLALVIPLGVISVLGVCEWLFDRAADSFDAQEREHE